MQIELKAMQSKNYVIYTKAYLRFTSGNKHISGDIG